MVNHAFIFARGGSKGLPGKNVKLLAGKPLIRHSIDIAFAAPSIDKVFVSTDDAQIAKIAEDAGAIVIKRPLELATDKSPEWLSWRHAVEYLQQHNQGFDLFVSLPATSPLRSVEDVENCIEAFSDDIDMVITVKEAERSPYFNMVTMDEQGLASLVITPDKCVARRQDAPVVYDMTTVCYVVRPAFIIRSLGVFSGTVRSVIVPTERAIDIDTLYDFKMAEFLMADTEN